MSRESPPKRKYELKKRAEEMAETHRRITEAAIQLHGTVGPSRTTMSAVARRAGVERRTLYRHFSTEADLFAACSTQYFTANPWPDLGSWRAISDPQQRLERALDELYAYYEGTEAMFGNVLRDAELVDFARDAVAPLDEYLDEAAEALTVGRRVRGRRRRLVTGAARHVLTFSTWRSLSTNGIGRSDAVKLATALVEDAARPRRGTPAATGRSSPARVSPASWARALHVTNGDATVPGLRGTGLVRSVLTWRDVLHEGPVPDVPPAELRRVRARFLAGEDAADLGTEAELAERDRVLAEHRDGEYVLWFEADLYDQLQIVQILARLRELEVAADRITLICIGEHLGVARFGGLGELRADQLARLPDTAATTLTPAALEHAARAWDALRSADPAGLNRIVSTPSAELRFVAEAYDRLSREYPSTRDGLSLTERRILSAVADGVQSAESAFVRAAARETRPFLGDTRAFDRMQRLRDAPSPLIATNPPEMSIDRHTRVEITAAGRRGLDGLDDHVARNGVDRWIGGVHLRGHEVGWRWNEGTESITTT